MKGLTPIVLFGLIIGSIPSYGDDYAKLNGWAFDNWDQNTVDWDIFQRAFIGVSHDDPLDSTFYHDIYSSYATDGQCFGMSLLSVTILKEGGHLGFCKPIFIYPGDEGPSDSLLRNAIRVMHAHQFGHAMVNWLIEKMATEEYKDAKAAYEDVDYYLRMNNPPLISIIKSFGEAHTMVPYQCEETGSDEWRIYVYDPNRPYRACSTYYDSAKNYIEVKPVGSEWSFEMAGGGTWSGSLGSLDADGIFTIPSSLVIPPGRNPLEPGALIQDIQSLIFSSDGGSIAQITDERRRRFYKTDADTHTKLSEIEDDPNLRMTNAIRWIHFGEAEKNLPEVYFIKGGSGGDLKLDIASKGRSYSCKLLKANSIVNIEASSGPSGRDRLEIHSVGTAQQELLINTNRGVTSFSVELLRALPSRKVFRTFKLKNLRINRASPVRVRLTRGTDGLIIRSEAPLEYDLEFTQKIGKKTIKSPLQRIKIAPKEWQEIRPRDWRDLKKIEVRKGIKPERELR